MKTNTTVGFTNDEHQQLSKCSMAGYGIGQQVEKLLDCTDKEQMKKHMDHIINWLDLLDGNRLILETVRNQIYDE